MTEGNEISRRAFLSRGAAVGGAAVLGVGGATALAGCSNSSTASNQPPATSGSSPGVGQGAPRQGGSATVGTLAEIDGFYPPLNHWDTNGFLYANTVYDPLMAIAADGSIQPYLAQSITPNATYDVWTMKLRPGVTFHDGSALTSSVVKSNFAALLASPLTKVPVEVITSVDTPDSMTVVYNLSGPRPTFPAGLTTQVGYVVAQAMIDATNSGQTPNPIGTGPFVYSQWQPNNFFTATKNPHYWRGGYPYLDQITYKPIPNGTQRAATLQSGGVDLILMTDPSIMSQFAANSAYQMVDSLKGDLIEPTVAFIMLNCAAPPTSDLGIRQALAKSMDQAQILKIFGGGSSYTKPASGLFLPGSPYYSKTSYPAYDLAGAKALVKQYKAQHGTPALQLSTIPDPRYVQVVQVIQQMWNQAGFDVSIKTVEQATIITDFITGQFEAVTSYQFGAIDPNLNYVWFSTTTVAPLGKIGLNFARNSDPQLEAAMRLGRSTSSLAQRIKAWQAVNERLAVDLPYLWLAQFPIALVGDRRIQNFAALQLPDGSKGYGFNEGVFFPSQVWMA
ncbi:MAG: ABC transporter substrate-binding protein [Acidimicrobiales bacterium]